MGWGEFEHQSDGHRMITFRPRRLRCWKSPPPARLLLLPTLPRHIRRLWPCKRWKKLADEINWQLGSGITVSDMISKLSCLRPNNRRRQALCLLVVCPSVRPSVLSCPSVNAYFTWGDISLSGGCFSTCHKIFITWVDAAEKQRSEVRGQGYSETKCTFMAEAHVWRRGSRGGGVVGRMS